MDKLFMDNDEIRAIVRREVQATFFSNQEFKKLVFRAVDERARDTIQHIVADEAFQQEIQEVIKELIKVNLRHRVEPFAQELWKHASKKFQNSLNTRLKELISLKTSTIQELSDDQRKHPIMNDEAFIKLNDRELKLLED